MENPNVLNANAEAIPEVNLAIPEPNHVVAAYEPNDLGDIPENNEGAEYDDEEELEEEPEEDPEEDPEEELEEEPEEDPEEDPEEEPEDEANDLIENPAEVYLPYDVVGDQDLPPLSNRAEAEANLIEGAEIIPRIVLRARSQRPPAVRTFPRCFYERGESSNAGNALHDSGLEPWIIRRDLEATLKRLRLNEAELATCRTHVALLNSKINIGEKERMLLNLDLKENGRVLESVLKKLCALENGENAVLKRKLEESEARFEMARRDRERAERELYEQRMWNGNFFAAMVAKGYVPEPPREEDTEGSRKKAKTSPSDETEGPSKPPGSPRDS